ncbi:MAG: nucleotidyltransferase family protein [Desulfosporosinus sp.]|nr:nucleotidyltransferase family protein [Desulfosporosinus sp.]
MSERRNVFKKIEVEDYSPEMKLLRLCCIKNRTDRQQATIVEIISHKIDWELFVKTVMKHRVYPIVYQTLSELKSLKTMDDVSLEFLRKNARKNAIKVLTLTGELVRLFSLLDKVNIKAISIKGPLLGLALYGDLALRTSKDLDILVGKEDLDTVKNMLISEGYRQPEYETNITPKQKKIILKTSHHFSFVNQNGVNIELHWRYYSQGYKIQFNEVWDRRDSVEIAGNKLNVLNSEENFLYLVFHGSKHGWMRLRWLCDVSEIINKNDLQWTSVIKRAEHLDVSYMLVQALILARELFSTKIPEELNGLVKNDRLGNRLAKLALPIINEIEENAIVPGKSLYIHFKKYLMAWNKGLVKKIVFVIQHFYPSIVDYQVVRFQDKHFFMYFLLRPYFKLQRSWQKLDQ